MKIPNPAYGLASSDSEIQRRYEIETGKVLSAGCCSLGAFQDALFPHLFQSARRPKEVQYIKERMSSRFKNFRVEPGKWTNHVSEVLEDAVISNGLALYAWPAKYTDAGHYEISETCKNLVPIPVDVLKLVRAEHGGLPSTNLGLRPNAAEHLRQRGGNVPPPEALVVVKVIEAAVWVEAERKKGKWPTQQGSGRVRKTRPRGRPLGRSSLYPCIVSVVEKGLWDGTKSIPHLMKILVQDYQLRNLSRDTVVRAVEDLHMQKGSALFRRKFGKRNRLAR